MPDQPASLIAEGLECIRGERTLFSNLSLALREQQCLHVVGANGSGKTSLLRIISGLNRADQGEILWHNETIVNNPRFFKESTQIGHKDGIKNELTAAENLAFYQQLEGVDDESLVDQYLAQMGILRCADLTANRLSFGQRRRLAFARLLQPIYKLWILDEPFTGIDVDGRQLIENVCLDHLNNGGMIVLTNHQDLQRSLLGGHLVELQL
ncbi:MAG: cytochrome c biogenesis heme-transporting ATPase CcmA [Pseudomonadota bacterium]